MGSDFVENNRVRRLAPLTRRARNQRLRWTGKLCWVRSGSSIEQGRSGVQLKEFMTAIRAGNWTEVTLPRAASENCVSGGTFEPCRRRQKQHCLSCMSHTTSQAGPCVTDSQVATPTRFHSIEPKSVRPSNLSSCKLDGAHQGCTPSAERDDPTFCI